MHPKDRLIVDLLHSCNRDGGIQFIADAFLDKVAEGLKCPLGPLKGGSHGKVKVDIKSWEHIAFRKHDKIGLKIEEKGKAC